MEKMQISTRNAQSKHVDFTYSNLLHDNVNKILKALNYISLFVLGALIFEYYSLFPLVETRHYYVEFIPKKLANVRIEPVNIHRKKELIESILRKYVKEREKIPLNSSFSWKSYSSRDVLKSYNESLEERKKAGEKVERKVHITRYQAISKKVSEVEFITKDTLRGKPWKEEKWLASIGYNFGQQEKQNKEKTLNPVGLFITKYEIKAR